jgi:hypothetical protein
MHWCSPSRRLIEQRQQIKTSTSLVVSCSCAFSVLCALLFHQSDCQTTTCCTACHCLTYCRLCMCLQDATDLVARLRAFHHTAQSQPDKKGLSQCGLDLINGKVRHTTQPAAALARGDTHHPLCCRCLARGGLRDSQFCNRGCRTVTLGYVPSLHMEAQERDAYAQLAHGSLSRGQVAGRRTAHWHKLTSVGRAGGTTVWFGEGLRSFTGYFICTDSNLCMQQVHIFSYSTVFVWGGWHVGGEQCGGGCAGASTEQNKDDPGGLQQLLHMQQMLPVTRHALRSCMLLCCRIAQPGALPRHLFGQLCKVQSTP